MNKEYNLKRFEDAQKDVYSIALKEIKQGYKQSHWMWYIFPQIHGLGYSSTSKYYAIKSIEEAKEYMKHPILSKNLIEISNVLLELETNDSIKIFGTIDSRKLQSCMTLFNEVCPNSIFNEGILEISNASFDNLKDEEISSINDEVTYIGCMFKGKPYQDDSHTIISGKSKEHNFYNLEKLL